MPSRKSEKYSGKIMRLCQKSGCQGRDRLIHIIFHICLYTCTAQKTSTAVSIYVGSIRIPKNKKIFWKIKLRKPDHVGKTFVGQHLYSNIQKKSRMQILAKPGTFIFLRRNQRNLENINDINSTSSKWTSKDLQLLKSNHVKRICCKHEYLTTHLCINTLRQ